MELLQHPDFKLRDHKFSVVSGRFVEITDEEPSDTLKRCKQIGFLEKLFDEREAHHRAANYPDKGVLMKLLKPLLNSQSGGTDRF